VTLRLIAQVLHESWASARAGRVSSVVTVLIVVAMCSTILLTTGRATGAESQVLRSITSAGSRTVVVRANEGSGLDSTVVQRVERLGGVSWVGAFGDSTDVSNTALHGGSNVSERALVTDSLGPIGVPRVAPSLRRASIAVASPDAAHNLGLVDGVGRVEAADQHRFTVVRTVVLPRYLHFLEPVVLVPVSAQSKPAIEVSALVAVARSPRLVAPLAAAIRSVLGVSDLTQVAVSTSETIARIHRIVKNQLGAFNAALLIIVVASSATLVAVVLFGLVLLRRRDFGRRRALGATRSLIVGLLLAQILELALVGVVIGSAVALCALAVTRSPLPPPSFVVASSVLATVAALVGSIVPAIAASRRDPLKELRVP
jgi:putative ABC transport system permease protein